MSCNCNSGETPEYYITLDGVGADGYSPEINIVQEDTSSFKLNLINKNNEQITPGIPKLEYLNNTFVTNDALNTTLEDYSTTAQIAATYLSMSDAATNYLKVDGSNANNPIAINNLSIQSIGTGVRVGSSGGVLTLQGNGVRPAYLQTGSTSKSLALYTDLPTKTSQLTNDSGFLTASDITNKMNTDGSNATQNTTINQAKFTSLSNNGGVRITNKNGRGALQLGSNLAYLQTGSYGLIADYTSQLVSVGNINGTAKVIQATSDKVYYEAYVSTPTDATKEIATLGDINNATITITQGGVVKGSINLNQSTDATIALDAGGGGASGNRIQLITEDGTRGVSLGINNTTKEAFMAYDIIGGMSFNLNLISGKTAPITLTKNSDGTYGIGLDYDNDTLKVNQDGQLYADIEAPTYTAGTGIDINNEEISVDSDYIEAHKAYLADGDTLTDPQGLQDVKYYNHSSFDLSKFNVVGTPTITADGIASNLNSSNYVTCNCINTDGTVIIPVPNVADNYSGEAVTGAYKVYKGSTWQNRWDLIIDTSNTTIAVMGFSRYEGFSYQTSKVLLKVVKSGYSYTIYRKVDDGDWDLFGTVTKEVNPTQSTIKFQGGSNVNLKRYQTFNNNREPIFTGCKTGIDTIKPDDYTVADGTPSITADGVFTSTTSNAHNYISLDNFTASGDLRAEFEFSVTGGDYGGYLINSSSSTNAGLYINNYGLTWALFGANNFKGRYYIASEHSYKLYLEWKADGTTELGIKRDDESAYSTSNGTWTGTLPTKFIIGYRYNNKGVAIFDLNRIKFYSGGNLVYQPCLKIPYTESKTGSKVVDSQYRGRVQDAYNYQGYAPYYTLDETNGNFTLPMGEIYGYITRLEGIVKDLQTRLAALESNINGGGASEPVQQNLLGMSPLSLGRPQLLGELNPEDEMNTMDIEPTEEVTQEELEPQPIEEEVTQEEIEEEPQETEEEPIEETIEEQEQPQEEGGQDE